MSADPKGKKRIVDPVAVRRALLRYPTCAACGDRAATAHHVVQKGAPHFGDDVEANVLGLCGSGSLRCHGAFHGSPYVVEVKIGERWGGIGPTYYGDETLKERRDAEWVGRRIGGTILRSRPDVLRYVLQKLGEGPGEFYLRRFYFVEAVDPARFAQ